MKKQSMFFKLFMAMALFIAVPVIAIAVVFSYQMLGYSEGEISKSAIDKLITADKLNSLIADNLTQRALEMTIGSTMNDLEGLTKHSEILGNPENIMRLYAIQNQLIDLANASTTLHSVYLYIDDSDYIFTSNQGLKGMDDFADTDWMQAYKEFRSTKSATNWMPTRTVRFSKSVAGELGPSNKVITFFYTFTPYTTTVKGVLVFNIYEESIRRLVNNVSESGGYIEIVNSKGDIISHVKDDMVGRNIKSLPYMREIAGSTSKEGHLITYTDSKRTLVSYYKSDFNKWIYIGMYPADNLMAKVNDLRSYTLYICLVVILVGILISYFISRRIYSPLKKLLQDIKVKKGIDMKSNESEMSVLSKAYDYLLREEAFLLENKDNMRDVYLSDLIKGKSEARFDKELTGIDFPYDCFVCAIIAIDRYKEFEKGYSREQQEYMRILILKVSEELLGSLFKCAGTVYEKKRIVLVINLENMPDSELQTVLRDTFLKIKSEIGKILDNSISIGIGSRVDSASGISDSFDKAQEALRYKLIEGCGSINTWADRGNESTAYYYPYVHEKYIFNILNAGAKDKLAETIEEMFREISSNAEIQYDNVIQIFNQLIGNTIKYLLDAHCNMGMIFGNSFNIYQALSSKETLDEIKTWLMEVYSAVADYLSGVRTQSTGYFEKALDYIHKNYKKDMDINKVADHAGVSYSHLRKIFKDETGENIVNYINNMRINESKRLLNMTDMTIREISLMLGYNNDQSFVRFFKKFEGIAPGEYRASNRKV